MLLEYKLFEPACYATDVPDWGTAYAHCVGLGPRAQVVIDTGHHAPGTNIEFIVAFLLRALGNVLVQARALGNVLVQARSLGVVGPELAGMRALLRETPEIIRYVPSGDQRAWDEAAARLHP